MSGPLYDTLDYRRRLTVSALATCFVVFAQARQCLLAEPTNPGSEVGRHVASATALHPATSADKDIWRIQQRCGVNCVYVYLRLRGRQVRYDDALNSIPLGRRGASMASLKAYLQKQGLNSAIIKTTPEYLLHAQFPVIALLEEGGKPDAHFSVVLSASRETVWLIDGTTGQVMPWASNYFTEKWSGYLLVASNSLDWLQWSSIIAVCGGGATMAHALTVVWLRRKKVLCTEASRGTR